MSTPIVAANPADASTEVRGARKRIPMSVPLRKLEVPAIPGYQLYWFRESNVARAELGGYEFVNQEEAVMHQHGIGTDSQINGSGDLGTRVTVFGGRDDQGKPENLVLMKIRQEWWEEDQKKLGDRNSQTMQAIFRGEDIGGSAPGGDTSNRYSKGSEAIDSKTNLPLFQRPTRKAT